MNVFENALGYLLGDEGSKYTNDPDDTGGPTKFGITLRAWARYTEKPVMPEEVSALTLFQAKPFYESEYWLPLACDRIIDPGIAIAIFDTGVLYGVGTASRLAQASVGNIVIDGLIGPATVQFLNASGRHIFLTRLRDLTLQRIDTVISARPVDEKFRKGWTNRANRLLTLNDKTDFTIGES